MEGYSEVLRWLRPTRARRAVLETLFVVERLLPLVPAVQSLAAPLLGRTVAVEVCDDERPRAAVLRRLLAPKLLEELDPVLAPVAGAVRPCERHLVRDRRVLRILFRDEIFDARAEGVRQDCHLAVALRRDDVVVVILALAERVLEKLRVRRVLGPLLHLVPYEDAAPDVLRPPVGSMTQELVHAVVGGEDAKRRVFSLLVRVLLFFVGPDALVQIGRAHV